MRPLVIAAIVAAPFALAVGLASATATAESTALSAKQQLGRSIFLDVRLSFNRNLACASCHGSVVGWTGPDGAINAAGAMYEGSIAGRFGDRKPPSAAYATQSPIFHMPTEGAFVGGNFWDGRATGEKLGNPATDQAQGPFLNPAEQALPDSACVVYGVLNGGYPVSFQSVWGHGIDAVTWPADVETTCATEGATVVLSDADRALVDTAYNQVALSIAAYEASPKVNAFTSKFDARRMKMASFTKRQARGFALFKDKGKCALCHTAKGPMPLFTDYTYDNLGIPANPENPVYVDNPAFVDLGLGGFLATRPDYASYAQENYGKFKVPTLRNVGLRPAGFVKAFGHNGYFKSLKEIVHFYNTRDVLPTCDPVTYPGWVEGVDCWPAPEYPGNMNTDIGDLGLTTKQEAAIVAFLKTLSDGYLPTP
ncbi:MAG: cytochrome-c peroxidase [Actinomycetota bacterium]